VSAYWFFLKTLLNITMKASFEHRHHLYF